MKKNITSILAALLLITAFISTTSCRRTVEVIASMNHRDCSGEVITQDCKITDSFAKIDASSGMNVIFTQGAKTKVTVQAPSDIINLVSVKVSGSTLRITSDEPLNNCAQMVTIQVESPQLTEIIVSSGIDFKINGPLAVGDNELNIEVSSGASIHGKSITATEIDIETSSGADANIYEIDSQRVKCDASSGSNIYVSGKCYSTRLKASSGADISATTLKATNGSAKSTSGSSISCHISSPNEISSSSGGSVSNGI